jgi:nucleotide-binding universal stress UspA family protein
MKTIIVAVDFSNATPGVLAMAVKMAQAFDAELQLFHAIEPEPTYTAYGFTPEELPAMRGYQEEAKKRAAEKLKGLAVQVQSDVKGVRTHIIEGSPLYSLIDYVKLNPDSLVVLGSHGHGVIASFLLGSVAEGMVRKATVPTLIVPAAEREL